MKAIAVLPGKPNSVHLRDVAKPKVEDVPNGRGVLIKILRVGVDGTDKEINAAEYGAAPAGDDYLILGHESCGRVEAVGPNVTGLKPGDYVACTVRRPGSSIYDQIGTYDMTTDATYFERGINLRHGFLTEYVVDDPEYIVRVPEGLRHVGVLMEPMSVVEKGIGQAYEIQRRPRVGHPRRAAVLGSSTLGLLATLVLRLRGPGRSGRAPRGQLRRNGPGRPGPVAGVRGGGIRLIHFDVGDPSRVERHIAEPIHGARGGCAGGRVHRHRSAPFRHEHESGANTRVSPLGPGVFVTLGVFHRAAARHAAGCAVLSVAKRRDACAQRQVTPREQSAMHFSLQLRERDADGVIWFMNPYEEASAPQSVAGRLRSCPPAGGLKPIAPRTGRPLLCK